MEQYSIVNILLKVNDLSSLDGTNVVQEIKNAFTSAIQDKENETEREAIETAYQDWTKDGSKIDHFFQFKLYLFGDSRARTHEQTLLHFAAKYGYQNLVNALLKAEANFDVMDGLGSTPLLLAASNGYVNVVNALIEKGANVNAQKVNVSKDIFAKDVDYENKFEKITGTLTTKKVTFYKYNHNEETSLYFHSEEDYQNAVKTLKDEGVDIVGGYSINRSDTSLHGAAENGHIDIVNALIQVGAKVDALGGMYKNTPLHLAAEKGHTRVVELLLKKGANINAQNGVGKTPLHLAAENNHIDVVNALIQAGAKVDALSCGKDTPLHLVAEKGHTRVVELLLEKGANINAQNGIGKTPLHLATFEGHAEVVQSLIDKKANVLLKDNKGWTPGDCVNRGIPKLLKEAEKEAQKPIKYAFILGIAGGVIHKC